MFPNIQGSLLSIDDSRIDPNNPSCLLNRTGDRKKNPQFIFSSLDYFLR